MKVDTSKASLEDWMTLERSTEPVGVSVVTTYPVYMLSELHVCQLYFLDVLFHDVSDVQCYQPY